MLHCTAMKQVKLWMVDDLDMCIHSRWTYFGITDIFSPWEGCEYYMVPDICASMCTKMVIVKKGFTRNFTHLH